MALLKHLFRKPRNENDVPDSIATGSENAESLRDEFLDTLRQCDDIILKISMVYTDRTPENVKDMYQDIVCTLWESWSLFRHECSAKTWVYRVAFNTAISKIRKRNLSPMFSALDENIYQDLVDECNDELVEQLYRLIDKLQPREKELIMLYLDCVPEVEIASILGISVSTVNHRINQIKNKLKKMNENER